MGKTVLHFWAPPLTTRKYWLHSQISQSITKVVSSFVTGSTSWRGTVAVPRRVINIFFAEADTELALAFPVMGLPMEFTEGFKSAPNTANSFSPMFPHASYIWDLMQSLYWSPSVVHRSRNVQRADVISKREHRGQRTDWVRWDFANTLVWIYFLSTRQRDS